MGSGSVPLSVSPRDEACSAVNIVGQGSSLLFSVQRLRLREKAGATQSILKKRLGRMVLRRRGRGLECIQDEREKESERDRGCLDKRATSMDSLVWAGTIKGVMTLVGKKNPSCPSPLVLYNL